MIDTIMTMIIFGIIVFGAFVLGFITGYMRPWEEDIEDDDIYNEH